ncbi:VOC family protein [Algirhabdus cladophorae]|uniref:VOC family protein n=1 Tax=Algirhabdus cladophorae TaxID=3377108 RepID=UPI003B8456E2
MTQQHFGLNIARVTLRVNDLDAMARFYEEVVGLSIFKKDGEMALLGVYTTPLLELRLDRHATFQPKAPGLYHTAFLLPSRGDLGAWLGKAIRSQADLDGASDHGVSEAIYLSDPEGNGIEIYADRSPDVWLAEDGSLRGGSRMLDMKGLLSTSPMWSGLSKGTRIGHVHLQVDSIDAADRFFVDQMGLDVMTRMPHMAFYSSGGYHHHFGANTHHSKGQRPSETPATGLIRIDLEMPDRKDLNGTLKADWGTGFVMNQRQRIAA